MFEKIKKWYRMGLWSDEMVRAAIDKGIVTQEQYQAIISQEV